MPHLNGKGLSLNPTDNAMNNQSLDNPHLLRTEEVKMEEMRMAPLEGGSSLLATVRDPEISGMQKISYSS